MFCNNCGHNVGSSRFCGQCGQLLQGSSESGVTPAPAPQTPSPPPDPHPSDFRPQETGQPAMARPTTPPIPPPPTGFDSPDFSFGSHGSPGAKAGAPISKADRLAATGKVVGLSGCLLALVFWVGVPLAVVLIALATSGSAGFAVVMGTLAFVGGFVYWVWKRTGR